MMEHKACAVEIKDYTHLLHRREQYDDCEEDRPLSHAMHDGDLSFPYRLCAFQLCAFQLCAFACEVANTEVDAVYFNSADAVETPQNMLVI